MEENIITQWAKENHVSNVEVYYHEVVEDDNTTFEYWGFKTNDCISYRDMDNLQKMTKAIHIIVNPDGKNLSVDIDIAYGKKS